MSSLEQEIGKHIGKKKLPKHLADRIRSKYKNLKQLYGITYDQTVLSFIDNPSLYLHAADIPSLAKFFGRHIDIWLNERGATDIVFSKKDNVWIRAARQDFKIGIMNPYSDKVESWSRVDSESKRRGDHYKSSRRKNKSKFNGCWAYIRQIEMPTYNKGIGVLEGPTKMKMYLGFKSPIGTSAKGESQLYMCLECERIPRRQMTNAKDPSKVYGYKMRIHGYPVGPKDIEDDFRGLQITIDSIPIIENSLCY